jgi:hypothetical protein
MNKFLGITSIAILLLSVLAANHTTAAPPVNRKAAGDYSTPYWGNSAGRSIRHARDYSSGFRGYARQAPSVNQRIAQQEADGVGHNIQAAKTQYAEVRKVTTDKETLASLDAIEKNLADAAKAHAEMDEMCKMEMVDGAGTMKCCEDIDAALEKALAEHEKLMKKLGPDAEPATAPEN